ncbi:Transposon Ty3-G Gag-Pol polyprotein [Pelomyxa schiedti]|nr:Transposon Ty3-G Gag-Pol polyprotein [Pelomyxa schiedti]
MGFTGETRNSPSMAEAEEEGKEGTGRGQSWENVDEEQRRGFVALQNEYQDVLTNDWAKLGRTTVLKHYIPTRACRPEQIDREISEMLRLNVIWEGCGEWVAPLSLSAKKDGTIRICTNFRGLNKETVKDNYPLPNVFEVLKSLSGYCWFSTLDLMAGFWQVPVAEEDAHKTGFTCHRGQFTFNVMQFGMQNASQTFQKLMDSVLNGLIGTACCVYIDDIIVVGRTFEEHLHNLGLVYKRLRGANLRARAAKCKFLNRTVSYLGHTVTEGGIQMDPDRIKAITDWPTPKGWEGDLETFVNMANYYARFIPDFAIEAIPLRELGVREAPWAWNEQREGAFRRIKELVAKRLLLEYPDYDSKFGLEIHTDASKLAMGAVLTQRDDKGVERVIEFASRATKPSEKNLGTITELEAAAVVWALKKFKSYIHGVGCVVKSDHKALTWMQEQEYPCPKVARWQMVLDDYGAVVEFRPGKESGDADALSRIPSHALMVIALGDSLLGWKGAQDKDEDCQAIAEWVGSGKSLPDRLLKKVPPRESFTIEQGVLYYLETDHNRRRRVKAIVVPKELQHQVMEDNHDSIFAGHLSSAYTWDRVRAHFWWPRARTDVVNYCESCRQCAVAKTPAHMSCAVGHPLPVPSRPGVVMSLDYVGPLRTTKRAYLDQWAVIFFPTKSVSSPPKITAWAVILGGDDALFAVKSDHHPGRWLST